MNSKYFFNSKKFVFLPLLLAAISAPLGADSEHIVQKGETLYSISRKYGITVQELSEKNKISGTDIKIGQKLTIPDGKSSSSQNASTATQITQNSKSEYSTYIVKKGDTWYGIARNHSITLNELYELNNADASSPLKIGQNVKIPSSSSQASAAMASTKNNSGTNSNSNSASSVASVPDLKELDTKKYSGKKGDSSLVWPVENPDVTYVSGKVSGVNLSAGHDEKVSAIMAGTVMFSGSYRGFGNVVFIQSKTGHIYAYTGLGKVLVSKGEYIDFRDQIGTVGINSYSAKPEISLMVFQNGIPIDPAKAPRG